MSLERWGCFCFLLPFRKSPFGLSAVWLERWILSLREGWEPVLIFWWRAYSTHNRQAPSILPLIWGVGVLRTSGRSDRDWKGSSTYSQIKASSKAEEFPVVCGILCLPWGPTCVVPWQAWSQMVSCVAVLWFLWFFPFFCNRAVVSGWPLPLTLGSNPGSSTPGIASGRAT